MSSSSFGESWLCFVAVLVGGCLLQDILCRQLVQQIQAQFHRSYTTPEVRSFQAGSEQTKNIVRAQEALVTDHGHCKNLTQLDLRRGGDIIGNCDDRIRVQPQK